MTSWRRLSLRVTVGVALFAGTVGHSRPASGQARFWKWAKDRTAKWYAAFNAGDASAMIQLYASDAVLLLQGETFNGRGAIEKFHTGELREGPLLVHVHHRERQHGRQPRRDLGR